MKLLLMLKNDYNIDFLDEAIEKSIATVDGPEDLHLLDQLSYQDSNSIESMEFRGYRKKTTISLMLEIDEDDMISIPGNLAERVKEMLKEESKALRDEPVSIK